MHDALLAHQAAIRFAAFAGVLALLLVLETLAPRRGGDRLRRLRWSANLPMLLAGSLLVRLALPLGAAGAALWAQGRGVGVFNHWDIPLLGPLAGLWSFLALDALIYWQHRVLHVVPWLWRIHRMHHSDVEFDATTALRFHPLEIGLSMLLKIGAVVALGAPALAVLAVEVALNAAAMFNHSNIALPLALDRWLRRLVVTPDMHRVHHSLLRRERDTNYGFNLSCWDHLFRSYTRQPEGGHLAMPIGLPEFRDPREQRFLPLLLQPLEK
jgi:sterol desaturase/sphingolipid hydroxylase (fatty acid hydroxylase superfamily)